MLASVTQILPLTNVRRTRMLPIPGKVAVHQGERVIATTVIATAELPGSHLVLDVRRALGLVDMTEVNRAITRQVGETLEKGDVIAEVHGLFTRIFRAPAAGQIVFIGGGQVMLRTRTKTMELLAGMSGGVIEVLPEFGAVIEENGVLVQCAWGNGKVDSGALNHTAEAQAEELTSKQMDVGMRGSVLYANHCGSADALRAGSEVQLRGLILGSMRSELVPVAEKMPYPIVLENGFGRIPLSDAAYRLLSTNESRSASVNAVFTPAAGERPEVIIGLNALGQAASSVAYFANEQRVRVVTSPYMGKTGTIIQVRSGTFAFPNGIRAPAADVQLDGDRRVVIPLANLEVLESSEGSRRGIV